MKLPGLNVKYKRFNLGKFGGGSGDAEQGWWGLVEGSRSPMRHLDLVFEVRVLEGGLMWALSTFRAGELPYLLEYQTLSLPSFGEESARDSNGE